MRKYYQAGLAIIASLSLIALLFYRHEYYRLRYVLEVFNYFGSESSSTNCTGVQSSYEKLCELRDYDDEMTTKFDEPIPSWHRLTDSIYVYSAYRTNNGEIRALALAKGKGSNLMLSCDIFYENDIEPIAGEFSYKSIESSSSDSNRAGLIYRGYHFVCNYPSRTRDKIIALIKFSTKYQNSNEAAIMLPVKDLLPQNLANETINENVSGICVIPPFALRPLIDQDMINFINFHSSIGIGNFIVYDFGIPPRFNNIMKRISKEMKKLYNLNDSSNNFTYTTITWNFPASGKVAPDIIKNIIQADCLYRTQKKIQIIATLTWNEYIVLKYHRKIDNLFRDIEKTKFTGDRYEISTINLCVDHKQKQDHENPKIFANELIFDKGHPTYIYYRSTKMAKKSVLIDHREIETRETTADVIVVKRYEEDNCDLNDLNLIPLDDRYVGKFSKTVENSTISKLFHLHAH